MVEVVVVDGNREGALRLQHPFTKVLHVWRGEKIKELYIKYEVWNSECLYILGLT
jgi:hypothetical protein